MSMTKSDAMKLAHAIMVIRPDWQFAGIMAAAERAPKDAAYGTVLVAMATAAMDPGAQTPAAFLNPVYWPSWSVQAESESAIARRDRLELQRSANILAELRQNDRLAASPERVREIRAGSRIPVKEATQ